MNEALFEGEVVATTAVRAPASAEGVELDVDVDRWAGPESWVDIPQVRCRVRVFAPLAAEIESAVSPGLRVVVAGHQSSAWSFVPLPDQVVRARAVAAPLRPAPGSATSRSTS